MTDYIHPQFTPQVLPTFVGYHLQIFTAGRAKISLQYEGAKKLNYFASCPKKDRQALARQKGRTGRLIPDHYRLIDMLLEDLPDGRVLRVYLSGNTNKTADNAHVVVSIEQSCLWLILSEMVHQWCLPIPLAHIVLAGRGPKSGVPSVFNEYMSSLEHDWEDAMFEVDHYRYGARDQSLMKGIRLFQKTLPTPREPQSAPARTQLHHDDPDGSLMDPYEEVPAPEAWALTRAEAVPLFRSTDAQPPKEDSELWEDPYDDPIFFAPDPDTGERDDDPYSDEDLSVRAQTTTIGKSTLYTGTALWEQVQG